METKFFEVIFCSKILYYCMEQIPQAELKQKLHPFLTKVLKFLFPTSPLSEFQVKRKKQSLLHVSLFEADTTSLAEGRSESTPHHCSPGPV
jgi:hypothetical protein